MKMAVQGPYTLDLENQKKNVFVTQLHDREDEEDITAFPVVKESGDKLIESGINTLQKTLLLKKEVEIDKVNGLLDAKRYEFKQRIDNCAQRQLQLQKKQQQMKDRVAKFEKFIQENEAKRRRAIQKYQQEVRLREQKALEFSSLSDQLEQLKKRHKTLEAKLKAYKIFEQYLRSVVDAMPEDYLPSTEDKIKGLMMRYRTLSESNKGLVDNLETISDELEVCRKEYEVLNQEHQKSRLSNTSELSQLLEKQEVLQSRTEQMEQNYNMTSEDLRHKRTEVGIIFMAIDNIYDKCKKPTDLPLGKEDWDQKLNKIKDYLQEREGVAKIVQSATNSSTGSSSTEQTKARAKVKSASRLKVTIAQAPK
ncbi:coiled-coil domain-containing protein 42 homolog [Biomphalaria glabrata]|uniref:Coiled-coil domain-containing protein 42 homolog n=1 Tax=Biomphalaria glabrata TaxID=6526 RepID=A0A2C9KRH0_BIOGL|nr:coiled-coil domain-containing protein 42 homolog [Biomphalaria glabrata]